MNRLPFGIGDFVTQLKEATFKGDFEGHPFRGNQYDGGESGDISSLSHEERRQKMIEEAEPLIMKSDLPISPRFSGESLWDAVVSNLGLDIVEEEELKQALKLRRI